nr:MAG TPA: hypothetical protein [Bacteriophage sp.]
MTGTPEQITAKKAARIRSNVRQLLPVLPEATGKRGIRTANRI